MNAVDSSRWYVVQTKPKQENRAESNLRLWRVPTLTPRLKQAGPVCAGIVRWRATPLFPGYLFARFDAETLLAKVRFTRGVHRVIGFGEYATPVDDAIIALIQSRIEHDGFVRLAEPAPGDLVEVVDGPLKSLVGVFDRSLSGHERVLILLTGIGCHARVQVPAMLVRKSTCSAPRAVADDGWRR